MITRILCTIVRAFALPLGFLALVLAVTVICTPPAVQSVVRPPFINTPANLIVKTVSSNSISLEWNLVTGTTHYQVERSETMSGPFLNIANVSSTTFTDTTMSNLNAYVYRVRAVGSGNVYSQASNMAVGTAITFQSDQLPGQPIKAQHLHDVRTAINAVRTASNIPAANWTRPTLFGLNIKASDVLELRSRLNEALTALAVPVVPYTDPILNTGANGTLIKAIHLEQLQVRSTRSSSASAGPLYPNSSRALVGEFGPTITLPLVPVHLSVLPDRRILFWGRDLLRDENGNVLTKPNGTARQVIGKSEAYVWNMATDERLRVANSTTNLFCSGHSFLPDGRLFVTGGHNNTDFDGAGDTHTNIFDSNNNSWTPGPEMDHGRWYPYNVTLGTGEPLVISGFYNETNLPSQTQTNLIPQVYDFAPGGDFKDLDPASPSITSYPYLHLGPYGKILQAQSGGFFICNATECFRAFVGTRFLNPSAASGTQWEDLSAGENFPHAQGSSVLLDGGMVLLVGGFGNGQTPTREAEFIDLSLAQPAWFPAQSMKFRRAYHTATVLPDGKVLVTGGVSCPGANNIESYNLNGVACSGGQVMIPELWDPQSGQWTMMAPHNETRAYHSVAALLPDGRILVGGGGGPGAIGETGTDGAPITNANLTKPGAMSFGHNNVEIYSPPYLFDSNGNPATRPVITSAPLKVSDGETFFIGTSGAGNQPKVSLVRLASVTHGFNQDQRQIFLDNPVLTSGGLFATAPSSPNECPPGYYMLFVLNDAGVPSVAKMIRVHNASLFPNDVPVTTASGAGQTWEQGITFSSFVDGQITHIRFWKAPGEPSGGHTGHIWNATTGLHLASAQFTNETASGWQEAQLQTPLPITAGTKYKVSYNIHSVVAKTFNALDRPVASWPLMGWGSSFSTPAGSFPATGSTSNLFVDVKLK